jgi:serine/threonine protein kinase
LTIRELQLADEDWSQLEEVVEAFVLAWNESETPPVIAEYLAACAELLRQPLAAELVKIDLEQRWQRGLRRVLEDYLEDVPELRQQISPQLICEEFRARKLAGDEVSPTEFFDRFPDLETALAQLFVVDPMLRTTIEVSGKPRQAIEVMPGEVIDDFDLLLILGKGAFATVFLARQRSMQRIVAVKISADKGHEPQTLAQLDHNNIVRVYDQRSVPDRGLRLLYMQYAAGGTLASLIRSLADVPRENWSGVAFLKAIDEALDARGEMPSHGSSIRGKLTEMSWSHVVCWLGAQLSRALDYAHRQGVLHRDLKPANVLLTSEGVPKLADFNISFSSHVEGSTPVSYFGGSLAYMSPEQLEACNPKHARTADSLDGRADLYSLGVLLWELQTGERPFADVHDGTGETPLLHEMTERRRRGPPTTVTVTHRDGVSLTEVISRCLGPAPDDRYQTGMELAHELELCLEPDARSLLSHPTTGWKVQVRRFPLFTITMLTVVPNLVSAVFNFLYNHREIMDRLPEAEPTFMRIQTIINLITFPTGIASAFWLAGSVAKATRIGSQNELSAEALAEQRRRCLDLGNIAALVGLLLWMIAAPAYPLSLHLILGEVPIELYLHFVASLVICGLIAAAYPFFGVSVVAVRCFYPSLVRRESMTTRDRLSLQQLARQTWLYLVLAASVPMIAVVILVVIGTDRRAALVVLAAGGTIGFGIAVTAFRVVQADLTTLIRAVWRDVH